MDKIYYEVWCTDCGFQAVNKSLADYEGRHCPACKARDLDVDLQWERFLDCCNVQLSIMNFTNTCSECAADYNSGGQLLAARGQWGEETGESLSDILNESEPWDDNY